jgi:two-component sensor histidine kinase
LNRRARKAGALPYVLAAGCVALASATQFLFQSLIAGYTNFGVFYPAVLMSALFGLGPGVFAAIVSALAQWLYFVPARSAFQTAGTNSILRLVIFSVGSTLIIVMAEAFRRAQASRMAANQLLKTAHDISTEGVVVYRAVRDRAGEIVDFEYRYANPTAIAIMAHSDPGRVIGGRLLERLPLAREHEHLFPRYVRVVETGETSQAEYEIGGRWFHSIVAKLDDGVVVTVRDITARRRSDEVQRLLAQELNHRVKNMLASVIAMTSFTGRGATSVEEFKDRLLGRFHALARAHGLLVSNAWTDALVGEVVRSTLDPHLQSDPQRFSIDGPKVMISPNTALALNMAIHELGTNAVKYGALSGRQGKVEIRWQVDRNEATRTELSWVETGGPAVEPPASQGFGMRLLERAFATTEEGEAELHFLPTGLRCVMRFESEPAQEGAGAPDENAGLERDRDPGFASRVDTTA